MEAAMTLDEKIERLTQGYRGTPAPQLDDLKKSEPLKKGQWGGKRAGAGGSKPTSEERAKERGIKAYLDQHVNEEVKIRITDPKTGKVREVSKPRIVIVLETLFNVGVQDKNPDALNKWLDRALGKPISIGKENNAVEPNQHFLSIDF
jgi:hypothetical protein